MTVVCPKLSRWTLILVIGTLAGTVIQNVRVVYIHDSCLSVFSVVYHETTFLHRILSCDIFIKTLQWFCWFNGGDACLYIIKVMVEYKCVMLNLWMKSSTDKFIKYENLIQCKLDLACVLWFKVDDLDYVWCLYTTFITTIHQTCWHLLVY